MQTNDCDCWVFFPRYLGNLYVIFQLCLGKVWSDNLQYYRICFVLKIQIWLTSVEGMRNATGFCNTL